ncbi:hypothetical protein M0R45_009165 [Rubus argutus]|uniref:Uncharacterized protein n=1 Tax=Rubus argutus TaxID=59490 RepID=A0AAW1Y2S7_RUBAR
MALCQSPPPVQSQPIPEHKPVHSSSSSTQIINLQISYNHNNQVCSQPLPMLAPHRRHHWPHHQTSTPPSPSSSIPHEPVLSPKSTDHITGSHHHLRPLPRQFLHLSTVGSLSLITTIADCVADPTSRRRA